MRKIYKMAGITCLGLMLSITSITAQTVSDFEGLTLSANTFWNGSDMSGVHNAGTFIGSFMDGTAIYPNVYDTTFGAAFAFWSTGFAYSNMTDSTTSGSGNLYSARTAIGYNNSSNYAVATTSNPCIARLTGAASNNIVSGVYITNTTYAANSMRDGDAFAKQFGGVSGNDLDWFKLTIWGYTSGNLTADSVEFYLADYRFPNNTQDYIIKKWNWVDLTTLGAIDSVTFVLTSSDNGAFGMNTPAFFALDNFNDQTVSIKEGLVSTDFNVYPNPAKNVFFINLKSAVNQIEIIDLAGKTVMTRTNLKAGKHAIKIDDLATGTYFIRVATVNGVTVKKLVKY